MPSTVNDMTPEAFSKLVATGVANGLSIKNEQSDHDSMMEQHMKVTGQLKAGSTMDKVSENIKTIAENQKNITELFESAIKPLSMMISQSMSQSATSSLAAQASTPTEMSRSYAPSNLGALGNAARISAVSSSAISSVQTTSPVASSQGYQEAMASPVPVEKNDYDAMNKKALADEEDRLFKEEARPVMPKLSKALDMFLEGKVSAINNGSNDDGLFDGWLSSLLSSVGGGVVGFAFGYLSKFADMWANVGSTFAKSVKSGWDTLQNTKVGKKISELGTKLNNAVSNGINKVSELGTRIKSAFTGGISKISELKASFSTMINGWKNTMKETTGGKVAAKTANVAKKVGGLFAKLAKGAGSFLLDGANALGGKVISGVKAAGSAIANSGIVQKAIKAARIGAKIGNKIPLVQAAGTVLDTATNIYKAAQNGASVKDMVKMGVAGAVDAVSDTFMIPELMNAAEGAINAAVQGKGIGEMFKGAASGFVKPRDENDISYGNSLVAKTMNTFGLGDASTRALAKASDQGLGWKEAGFETISGAAGGFGHSAAVYRPKAAGSMENVKTPTADVVPNLPNESPMSEQERMRKTVEAVTEGVKAGMLSPEVQEANAANARETGAAINGSLFGG